MSYEQFWKALDTLLSSSRLFIDRPKGTYYPGFPEIFYPVVYGYLENTSSMDGNSMAI